MILTDRGLVLRSYKLRETSKIVGILAFEQGRVRLVAHGSRGASSHFGASLEAGNEVEIVYSVSPGRELGTLREATLRRAWLAGLGRLAPLGAGLAMLELLDRLVPEGAAEPGLATATVAALEALAASRDRGAALLVFYAYELRLLAWLGLRPALVTCAGCGTPAGERAGRLDVGAGAYSCRGCASAAAGRLALPAEVAGLLAALASAAWPAILALETTPRARRLAGIALHRLMATHVESYRYPRSLGLLKKVDASLSTNPDSGRVERFPTPPSRRS